MAWEGSHYLIQILKSDKEVKAADFWIVYYFSLSEMHDYKFKFESETSAVVVWTKFSLNWWSSSRFVGYYDLSDLSLFPNRSGQIITPWTV